VRPGDTEVQRPRPQRRTATTSQNVFHPVPNNIALSPVTSSLRSPTTSGSRGISIRSLTTSNPSPIPQSAVPGVTVTTADSDTAPSTASEVFEVQTLQGIQLHLNHNDIRADSPDGCGSIAPFTVSAEEEFLIQHYACHLAKWVRKACCRKGLLLAYFGFDLGTILRRGSTFQYYGDPSGTLLSNPIQGCLGFSSTPSQLHRKL
jgi:hypothetical protein